jgi:hypothetical protein
MLFKEFVAKLREFLGVDETLVNFEEEWTKDDPMGTGKTFEDEFIRARLPLNMEKDDGRLG